MEEPSPNLNAQGSLRAKSATFGDKQPTSESSENRGDVEIVKADSEASLTLRSGANSWTLETTSSSENTGA